MAYSTELADRVRESLAVRTQLPVAEKRMFGGLAFLVDGKMCVNVSGDRLMCRFDPNRQEEIARSKGYSPMIMKGREYSGYCYVSAEAVAPPKDLELWIDRCLAFNPRAKSSRK